MSSEKMKKELLKITNLKVFFPAETGFFGNVTKHVHAVDDVSFDIYKGETLGLVGESGCGKTTIGRAIVKLNDIRSGQISYEGTDLAQLNSKELLTFRKKAQIIFQDPLNSLNPVQTVLQLLSSGLKIHTDLTPTEIQKKVEDILAYLGIIDGLTKYPHEFSGGQQQRINIARAILVKPDFIICDEPVASLDVSIQAQILNLLKKLKQENDLSYLFISHDLAVVKYISDRIIVLYLGKIMEIGTTEEIFINPLHPYTKVLVASIPGAKKKRIILEGELPSPVTPPKGCRFCTRCPDVMEKCHKIEPELISLNDDVKVACHLYAK